MNDESAKHEEVVEGGAQKLKSSIAASEVLGEVTYWGNKQTRRDVFIDLS